MNFIRSLQSAPFTESDYVDHDPSDRQRQIKMIGDYAITYWADHAAKIVMIVDVCPAD